MHPESESQSTLAEMKSDSLVLYSHTLFWRQSQPSGELIVNCGRKKGGCLQGFFQSIKKSHHNWAGKYNEKTCRVRREIRKEILFSDVRFKMPIKHPVTVLLLESGSCSKGRCLVFTTPALHINNNKNNKVYNKNSQCCFCTICSFYLRSLWWDLDATNVNHILSKALNLKGEPSKSG